MVHGTNFSEPDYARDIARLFPAQGEWTEHEYLNLTHSTNQFVEFTDGRIEVLAPRTCSHQGILGFIAISLYHFVRSNDLGESLFGPLRVRLRPGLFREPEVVFMLKEHAHRANEEFWEGADLVMEVLDRDPESRRRDLVDKRREYAQGGIPEYWIVDPQEQRITVLKLTGSEYSVHGEFTPGQLATSALLPGFHADVTAVFDAATR